MKKPTKEQLKKAEKICEMLQKKFSRPELIWRYKIIDYGIREGYRILFTAEKIKPDGQVFRLTPPFLAFRLEDLKNEELLILKIIHKCVDFQTDETQSFLN